MMLFSLKSLFKFCQEAYFRLRALWLALIPTATHLHHQCRSTNLGDWSTFILKISKVFLYVLFVDITYTLMFIYLISSYFDMSLNYRSTNIFTVIHLRLRIKAHYEVTAEILKIFSRTWLFRSLSIGHKVQDLCDIYVSFYTLKVENNKNFPRSHCQLSKLTFWNRLFISNSHGSETTS